jgi:mannose-1-phosphate guanylyltransferase
MRIAVIMAGGSGERFWPLSKPHRPKQLLKLTSATETMLEEAVNRIKPLVGEGNVYIATGGSLRSSISAANVVDSSCVLAEPARRNTLGCLAWVAANLIASELGDSTVAVLTADHSIQFPDVFRATVDAAMDVAEKEDGIVTIGIVPTRPETGYGYIETDQSETVRTASGRTAYKSRSFREKPSQESALQFVQQGNFYWNGGMFFFRLPIFMRELSEAQPETHRLVNEIAVQLKAGNEAGANRLFEEIPSISIDFAVMEKAKNVYAVPSDFPWDDMGSWDALERSFDLDSLGNVSQGDNVLIDTHGSIVYNDIEGAKIGIVGMDDVIVVATGDAFLVCPKSQAQRVKEIVQALNGG